MNPQKHKKLLLMKNIPGVYSLRACVWMCASVWMCVCVSVSGEHTHIAAYACAGAHGNASARAFTSNALMVMQISIEAVRARAAGSIEFIWLCVPTSLGSITIFSLSLCLRVYARVRA